MNYSKDGITVATTIDTNHPRQDGTYPIVVGQGKKNAPKTTSTPITNPMVTVPLSLLLSLASVNAPVQAGNSMSDVENDKIELLEQSQQTTRPNNGHNAHVNHHDVVYRKSFSWGKDNYTLYYDRYARSVHPSKTRVVYVHVIPWDYNYNDPAKSDMLVKELIIHEQGDDNWLEVRGSTEFITINDKGYYYHMSIKITDGEAGQDLIDLISGDSDRFINGTKIKVSFTTNPYMQAPKLVEARPASDL